MNRNISKLWIAAGVLGVGVLSATPTTAFAAREETRSVKYDSLPREVRRTLDEERGDRPVIGVQRVDQDGKEFYRCTVALKHGERSIRIQPGGNLMSVEDVREADVPAYHKSADDWSRAREDRERAQAEYWAKMDEQVRATARDPERVRWDDLPARVRAAFIRESFGEKVDYIVRYRDGGHVIYQSNIPDGPGRVRMVQIGTDGGLLNAGGFTTGGRAVEGDFRVRRIEFEELPRSVRSVLDREYRGARIPHIDMTVRRGQRVYNVTIQDTRFDRYLVIDEDGEVLSDIPGREYDLRR